MCALAPIKRLSPVGPLACLDLTGQHVSLADLQVSLLDAATYDGLIQQESASFTTTCQPSLLDSTQKGQAEIQVASTTPAVPNLSACWDQAACSFSIPDLIACVCIVQPATVEMLGTCATCDNQLKPYCSGHGDMYVSCISSLCLLLMLNVCMHVSSLHILPVQNGLHIVVLLNGHLESLVFWLYAVECSI